MAIGFWLDCVHSYAFKTCPVRTFVRSPRALISETEVARVLTELGRGTTREIHQRVAEQRTIDFATVQTYLQRLETKGYAQGKNQGRTRIWSPRVRLKTLVHQTVGDLVDRLFAGQAMPLVRHLIEDNRLSEQELEELKRMLE